MFCDPFLPNKDIPKTDHLYIVHQRTQVIYQISLFYFTIYNYNSVVLQVVEFRNSISGDC